MIDKNLAGIKTDIVPIKVSREKILAYCEVIGEENPLYKDVQAAQNKGYKDILIPPTYPTLFWQAIEIPWLTQDATVIQSEQNFTYKEPLVSNKTYSCQIVLESIRERGNKQFLKHCLYITSKKKNVAISETTLVLMYH